MIETLKKFGGKKLGGLILIAVIIIAFGFGGFGGGFSTNNQNNIAKINKTNVTTQDFMNYLNESGISQQAIRENLDNNIKSNTNKINIFSSTNKIVLSYFIALQYTRTNEFRVNSKKLFNDVSEDVNNKSNGLSNIQFMDDKENKFQHLRDLFYHAKLIQKILLKYKWILYRNFTKVPYITSDNPVTKKPNLKGIFNDYGLGSFGFESKGIEIHFPLSPKYELIIHEPKYFKKVYTKKFEKIHIVDNDMEQVEYSNSLLIQHSNYLYSIKNDFKHIENVLFNIPELKNKNRVKRVENIFDL